MVVDTSVLVAILKKEHGYEDFAVALARSGQPMLSSASYLEAIMVLAGRQPEPNLEGFDQFLSDAGIEIAPVTMAIAQEARVAFLRYGKGRHPARLNFGDCFSYALAKNRDEPLLFKGNDFTHTDVKRI